MNDVAHKKEDERYGRLVAVELRLAKRLYDAFLRADPSADDSEWDELTDWQREHWRLLVDAIFEDRYSAKEALELADEDDGGVGYGDDSQQDG